MEEIANQLHEVAYSIGKVVNCMWFFFVIYCLKN